MILSFVKKWTYLPANIFIDDGGLWTNIGNKKVILVQMNNHNNIDFNKIVPMSIENEPKIFLKNEEIELNNYEMEQIKEFINKCQMELIKLSEDSDHLDFFEKINNKGFLL